MDNIRFLTEILMSDDEYWCALKEDKYASTGKTEREVWFISIPTTIKTGIEKQDIKLIDLEELQSSYITNIPLSQSYPPFQSGVSMYNFTQGFPIKGKDARKFLINALALDSKDLYEYQGLLSQIESIK